jgi:hypothetical protein
VPQLPAASETELSTVWGYIFSQPAEPAPAQGSAGDSAPSGTDLAAMRVDKNRPAKYIVGVAALQQS